MLRSTPLQLLSVVKIAPGSGAAFSAPPASNDPIARAAIIAPRVNVNVVISFISIFLGLVCFECDRSYGYTGEILFGLVGRDLYISYLLLRKWRAEFIPESHAFICLPI